MDNVATRLKLRKSDNTWDIIDAIGWDTTTTDFYTIRDALEEVIPGDKLSLFIRNVESLVGCVFARAEEIQGVKQNEDPDFNLFNAGDDGWPDASAHVVGLGKESYDKFMKDPISYVREKERKQMDWYVESFLYVTHIGDDY